MSWYHWQIGDTFEVKNTDYYLVTQEPEAEYVRTIKKSDCEIIKEVEVNEKHEKYCRHSKFANGLCGRVLERESCSHGAYAQCHIKWETCAISSQQVEVIEKDLVDQIIDWYYKGITTEPLTYVTRGDIREIITEYVKRLEAEKKPCDYCTPHKELSYHYCGNCGRKL